MKLFIMQLSPTSYNFIHLRSKYSLPHPVLKHPQSVVSILEYKFAFRLIQICLHLSARVIFRMNIIYRHMSICIIYSVQIGIKLYTLQTMILASTIR
jgi:hypothetical protein